jgi:hypothetical protein
MQFQKAVKRQAKLRLGLDGPSGSGKTYTALVAATALKGTGKVAVIDTERGSASLYADLFNFDVLCLDNFNPHNYIEAIHTAEKAGYTVIVIDSLSHAWEGEGGVLDLHDQAQKRQNTQNSFTAWKDVTPIHRSLVDAMLQSSCHVIATMRTKTEYVIETIEKNGRTVQQPRKIGTAPVQRQGMEYEFTIVGDIDVDHNLVISKSRMATLADAVVSKPNVEWFAQIATWLNSGEAADVEKPAPKPEPAAPKAPAVVSSDGTPYAEMETPQLTARFNQITKTLKNNGLTPEQKAEYEAKRDEIQRVISARSKG